MISDDRCTVRCAEWGGELVGFISMGPPDEPATSDTLELHGLYVLPERWGTGVGSQLYAVFAAHVGGFAGALDVWSANERAIAFWERHGWTFDGRSRPRA